MPPLVRSSTWRPYNGPRNTGYQSPQNRWMEFKVDIDLTNLPSLPERLDEQLEKALQWHFRDAAQRVIDTARHYLVRLEESPVKYNLEGLGIHGYDTGLMYVSLMYRLMVHFAHIGVIYELTSDEAKYWRFVEFGFHTADGSFWPGYHFLETAIEENEGYIRQKAREAWEDTAFALAMEAHVPGARGRLGFTS